MPMSSHIRDSEDKIKLENLDFFLNWSNKNTKAI